MPSKPARGAAACYHGLSKPWGFVGDWVKRNTAAALLSLGGVGLSFYDGGFSIK